jgi:surface protein
VSGATDMEFMFGQSVFNQPLDNWDVSNVTNMGFMFFLTPFNQNISGWCVEQIATEPDNFNDGDSIDPQNKPLWGEPC